MKRYRRLLVALRFDAADESLVRYAGMVARLSGTERVYFAHVAENLELPQEFTADFADAFEPLDESARADIEALVAAHFEASPQTRVDVEIREGAELIELLRLARRKRVDLVVVGRGPEGDPEHAALPVKLARKAPCSVLVVPPGTPPRADRILVPIDFSTRSRDALEVAVAFADAAAERPLEVMNVFRVPMNYFQLGHSHAELAVAVRRAARDEMRAFLAGSDLRGITVEPLVLEHNSPAVAILETAAKLAPNLVVIGTRGHTDSAAVLLGSTCEQVIAGAKVPVLAAKRGGDAQTFLDALLDQ